MEFLKDFFGEIEKLSNSNITAIRNISLEFYKEAYKWMGDNMLLFTANVKKQVKQDLEKFIEEWPKDTIMSPLIASDEVDVLNEKSSKSVQLNENDMFDILEGVDVFGKYNDNYCEKVLNQVKWNEKKELLDELISAINVPKLQSSNYYAVLSMVKKVLNDSNVNVMCCGIKILGLLAKAIRKPFNSSAKAFFPILLSKFKDKKTFIIDEAHKSLESFLYCFTTVEEIQEDLKDALHDKVLGLKINSLIWLDKYLEKLLKSAQKSTNSIKNISPLIKSMLDDGANEVRDYATKILGKIKAVYGKEFIPGFFADIQPNKLQKIDDAEEKYRGTNPNLIQNGKSLQQNNAQNLQITQKNDKFAKKDNNKANNMEKKGLENNKNKAKNEAKNSMMDEEFNGSLPCNTRLSLESAESLLNENNMEFFLKSFEITCPWIEKSEAMKEINRNYIGKLEENTILVEALIVIIKHRFKDWKESNINLIKEYYTLLITWAESSKKLISKKNMNLLIPFFLEKMIDGNKYREFLWSFTIKVLNYTSTKVLMLEFIMKFQEILNNDIKKANPKTINELIAYFTKLIDLVSLNNLPFKEIVDFCKSLSASTNSNIKQSVINLMKSLFSYVGQQFLSFISDLNPAFIKNLKNEFTKVKILDENDKKPKMKIFEENEKNVQKTMDLLESLPRVDVSSDVTYIYKYNIFF